MSLETWKQEFYPKAAEQFNSTSDPLEAAEASLLKWTGLRLENMSKHWVRRMIGKCIDSWDNPMGLVSDTALDITSSSCSLCSVFLNTGNPYNPCGSCPLASARGWVPCDRISSKEKTSPYNSWAYHDDPEPMIYWLQKTVGSLKEGGKHDGNRETSSDSSGDNPPPEVQA